MVNCNNLQYENQKLIIESLKQENLLTVNSTGLMDRSDSRCSSLCLWFVKSGSCVGET